MSLFVQKGRWIMNAQKKIISTLGLVMLSILFVTSSAIPAAAARDRGPRGGRSSDRGRSSRSHDRDSRHSGLSIGFGFSNRIYSTSYRRWVPGYYQTRTEQILVEPSHYEWQSHQVEVAPARYEVRSTPAVEKTVRDENGKQYTVIVEPARTETVYIPPKYEQRRIKVWIPDRYETRQIQIWIPGYWVSEPAYPPSRFRLNIGGVFRF